MKKNTFYREDRLSLDKSNIENYLPLVRVKKDISLEGCVQNFINLKEVGEDISLYDESNIKMDKLINVLDISIYQNSTLNIPIIKKICGNIYIHTGTIDAQKMVEAKKIEIYYKQSILNAPNLKTIKSIVLREHANITLNALQKVCEGVWLRSNSSLHLPKCNSIGKVDIYDGCTLDAFNVINIEHIEKYGDSILNLQKLRNITGTLTLFNTIFTAPSLKNVKNIIFKRDSKFEIPQLEGLIYKSIDDRLFVITKEKQIGDIKVTSGYFVESIKNGRLVKDKCHIAETRHNFGAREGYVRFKSIDNTFHRAIKKVKQEVKISILKEKAFWNRINLTPFGRLYFTGEKT